MIRLDRYVAKRFFYFLLLSTFASMAIFLVVDPIENLDKFLDREVPTLEILRYYLLYIPYIIYLIYPVAVLLATMFCIGGLTVTNELMAMTASGVPLWRHLAVLSTIGLVLSLFMFWWGESVVPQTNRERLSIWREQVRQHQDWRLTEQGQVYLQDGPGRVLHLDLYQPRTMTGYGVDLYQFSEDGRVLERVAARSMNWENGHWMLRDVIVRYFEEGQERIEEFRRRQVNLQVVPEDMVELKVEPEEMSLAELRRFVDRIVNTGGNADRWKVDVHSKIALPFAGFIIVLFGVPVSAVRRRSGVTFGIALSLLISFVYFGIMQVGKVLGYKELLSPLTAAWLGNILFFIIGIILYRRTPR